MKKRLAIIAALVVFLVSVSTAFAKGSKNGTYVRFSLGGTTYESYWMTTKSGLVHEWRFNEPTEGTTKHFVFKPTSKFSMPDCDSENLSFQIYNWTYSIPPYGNLGGDEADLNDFLTEGSPYHVCAYQYGE